MKKYIAIGHWDGNENTTSVADVANTKAHFEDTLRCNGFRAFCVLTENRFDEIKRLDSMGIYEAIKGLTSNYRKHGEVADYIEGCADIMEERLAKAAW